MAAALALLMTSISLYLSGAAKLAYSWLLAPLVLNLTHWGLDKVGACATAHSADRDADEREALAAASDMAVERAAPVLGVAAAAAGVALIVSAHGYTLRGVGAHWVQTQVLGWGWGFVVDTAKFAFRRRLELNAAKADGKQGAPLA